MKSQNPWASALLAPLAMLLCILALVLLGTASQAAAVVAVCLLPLSPFAGFFVAKAKAARRERLETARKGWEALQKMLMESAVAFGKAHGADVPDFYKWNEEMGWVENSKGVDWPLTRSKRKDLGLPVHEQDPDTASAATV